MQFLLLQPELLTMDQLAMILNVSRKHLHRMWLDGRLPNPVWVGESRKSRRWRRREVEEWVDAGMPPRSDWERLRRQRKVPHE